jgi:ABC-type transport system involved in multi-copper enzyme maturation permease subunit
VRARLNKEFRALLLPWLVAVVAGGLSPFFVMAERLSIIPELPAIVAGLLTFAFCACLGLMVASSFGTEYQQRTLPLLLAQPVERFRLWNEKLVALVLALAAAGMIYGVSWMLACVTAAGTGRRRRCGAGFRAHRPDCCSSGW